MNKTKANGIEICYEEFGSPDSPALLLIMGLGAQMIAWEEDFCELLASRGFRVVRFDNRDVGESTWFDEAGVPDLQAALTGEGTPAYKLDDMADDAAGLLDALEITQAHVVGASMGGMIAQLLALRHPAKVLSLTSIMSHAGGPDVVPPTPEAMAALVSPRPADRAESMDLAVRIWRVLGSPGFPFDEPGVRERAGRAFDRGFHPAGFMRQIAAIMTSPGRAEALGSLRVPTLVIHGEDDPLVPVANGRATAAAVPGAELLVISGMGHDLPRDAWPRFADAIVANTAKTAASA